jgi:hypothetical protein
MTKKKAPLKAVKKKKEEKVDQDAINLFDLKFKDTPPIVQELYGDYLKEGKFNKKAYKEVEKNHKEYITPDIELAYKYNSIPQKVKDDYDNKMAKVKAKLFEDVIYPAEGNDEYMKNPEKYAAFDKAKQHYKTRCTTLFNKHFRSHGIKINRQGNVIVS